jgi:hypothetical protein
MKQVIRPNFDRYSTRSYRNVTETVTATVTATVTETATEIVTETVTQTSYRNYNNFCEIR